MLSTLYLQLDTLSRLPTLTYSSDPLLSFPSLTHFPSPNVFCVCVCACVCVCMCVSQAHMCPCPRTYSNRPTRSDSEVAKPCCVNEQPMGEKTPRLLSSSNSNVFRDVTPLSRALVSALRLAPSPSGWPSPSCQCPLSPPRRPDDPPWTTCAIR